MACKGSGVQIPSAPPGMMYLQASSLGPLTLCTEWIISGAGDRRLVWRGYVGRRKTSGQPPSRSRTCRQAPPEQPWQLAVPAVDRCVWRGSAPPQAKGTGRDQPEAAAELDDPPGAELGVVAGDWARDGGDHEQAGCQQRSRQTPPLSQRKAGECGHHRGQQDGAEHV